jgi:hypothetical protein
MNPSMCGTRWRWRALIALVLMLGTWAWYLLGVYLLDVYLLERVEGTRVGIAKMDYVIYLANRKPDALAAEAERSCGATCKFPIAGLALTPPQEPFWFEGHTEEKYGPGGAGLSQQLHPSRAVLEILKSQEPMSMMAVDIGASGGSPECGPLFNGTLGHVWSGAQVDARVIDRTFENVQAIQAKAEPPTIAKLLQNACMPKDIDLLKLDIDCYDWDVAKAILDAGFRPKVFAAEITIGFPPPVHFHISYWPGYEWVPVSTRHPDQQVLVGASLSACAWHSGADGLPFISSVGALCHM